MEESTPKKRIPTGLIAGLAAAALAAVLVIGSVTPIKEITRTTSETIRRERAGEPVCIEDLDPMEASWRDNFFGGTDSFFYHYLVR